MQWTITQEHIERLWPLLNPSSPGPHGIPNSAYVNCPTLSQPLFLELAKALTTPGTPPPPDNFNEALLFLLPKKPLRSDPDLGAVFLPSQTRPISVVNTDNRISASLLNMVFIEVASSLCFPGQRGFIPGRLISANIYDMDYAAKLLLSKNQRGALFFFDFEAAFPSVAHEYL